MKYFKIVIGLLFLPFLSSTRSQGTTQDDYNFSKYLEKEKVHNNAREIYVNNDEHVMFPSATDLRKLCFEIPFQLRFDCYPESAPTIDECTTRGCCFDDTVPKRETARIRNPTLPELLVEDPPTPAPMINGPPICFFPKDYVSYNFTSVTHETMGPSGTLRRYSDSGFVHDITELKIDFLYETDTRIRVKVR